MVNILMYGVHFDVLLAHWKTNATSDVTLLPVSYFSLMNNLIIDFAMKQYR